MIEGVADELILRYARSFKSWKAGGRGYSEGESKVITSSWLNYVKDDCDAEAQKLWAYAGT